MMRRVLLVASYCCLQSLVPPAVASTPAGITPGASPTALAGAANLSDPSCQSSDCNRSPSDDWHRIAQALYTSIEPTIRPEDVADLVRRASALPDPNRRLAAVLAELHRAVRTVGTGRVTAGFTPRDVLIKAMDAAGIFTPTAGVWFVQGLIAEDYGDLASARLYYTRVSPEQPFDSTPGGIYYLAQHRLARLTAAH